MSDPADGGLQPQEVARVLAQIATLMELNGRDPFRARAFASAARALEVTDADLAALARSDALTTLRGIGPAISSVVREIVLTGRSTVQEELEAATPLGLFELMRIPGLGPKRIRALYAELGIDSLDALEAAAGAGSLAGVSGFGAKTVEKVLAGIHFARSARGQRRYPEALAIAVRLLEWLRERPEVAAAEIVGAVRRRLEVVSGVDLVVATRAPGAIVEAFHALNVGAAQLEGSTLAAELSDGLPLRLRLVAPEAFVPAVVWDTGSEAHLEELRRHAEQCGLRLHPDGLLGDRDELVVEDEPALYKALGLPYLPPELREGLGEVAAAIAHGPPRLVETQHLRGTFHCHTTYSDGKATLAEMAAAAAALGWEYLGLGDHSRTAAYAGGLSVGRVREQHAEIDAWNAGAGRIRLFKGIESDILPDGSLDYDDAVLAGFDYVVGSVHSSFGMSRDEMTGRVVRAVRNRYLTILGHPTGRLLLTRSGYDIDLRRVIDTAAEEGVVIEINANAHRLDLDWREARYAASRGVLIAINPDAHSTAGLEHVAFGVNMARKAGLAPEQILNCWPLDRVEEYFAERKQARAG